MTQLPRGGVYVRTPAGAVQFGVPPETIKDSMAMGLPIPATFVVPRELFDRRRGVSLAEVEFPAYYNYFMLDRKVRLVVADADTERRIRAVFQESLFGPDEPNNDDEYDSAYPAACRPDFVKETDYFRRAKQGRRRSVDDLIDFVRFDGAAEVHLGEDVRVVWEAEHYVVLGGDEELGRAPVTVELPDRQNTPSIAPTDFEPPAFGVTVLGASHGFDPKGKTTGFLLWVGGRGILIDPPGDTTEHLRDHGVSAKLIEGVILTHCHADHDSGVFQKLLEEGRIPLYTTPTILGSFLRKYSALSGIDDDVLRRTFEFRPVKIGAPTRINGSDVYFFYTLHSIPTIGFEAFYGGKSLAFSSDTLYDPARIHDICEQGVITEERRDSVLSFPWHHTVILHEAGVPPLHTSTAVLAQLPADVKERLFLVHIASKDVPRGKGLRAAEVGLSNTIRIPVHVPEHAAAAELFDAFCAIDLFRDLPIARARELLQLARRIRFAQGERIIAQDTAGDCFYVIATGSVSVVKNGERIKTYHAGDYFGEGALVRDQKRSADVMARSDVELLALDRHGFSYLFRGTDIPRRLERLTIARDQRSWQIVEKNSALRALSAGQKTQLQTFLESRATSAGDILWSEGDTARAAYLVEEGTVNLLGYDVPLSPFGEGALLAEVDALRRGEAHQTTARVLDGGNVFRIEGADFLRFLEENPGVHLSFIGARFVE